MLNSMNLGNTYRRTTYQVAKVGFYPGKAEYIGMQKGVDYVADRAELERVASARGVTIVDIAKRPEWRLALYRDDPHPTAEGNRVLADILATEVSKAL